MDGHALVHDYEAMRRGVVEPGAASQDVRGLALLLRKGLAAWMRCVGTPVARPASVAQSCDSATPRSCAQVGVPGIEQKLVNIVAALALAHAGEEVFA